jgi:hypothetical protein
VTTNNNIQIDENTSEGSYKVHSANCIFGLLYLKLVITSFGDDECTPPLQAITALHNHKSFIVAALTSNTHCWKW